MRRTGLLLAGLTLGLAACDGEDPVESALREASAANHARAAKTTAEVEAASTMPATPTTDPAAQSYRDAVIADHRRAIARAEGALATTQDPETRRLAQAELDRRTRELTAMEAPAR